MTPNNQHKAGEASFPKLKGPQNYESWARNMTSALQTAELWYYVTGQRKISPSIMISEKSTAEEEERVWKRNEARIAYQEKARAAVERIYSMCAMEIQQEISSYKSIDDYDIEDSSIFVSTSSKHWSSSELWQWLKSTYTLKGWSVKWNVYNSFNDFELKNLSETELLAWGSRSLHLLQQIEEHKLTASDIEKMIMLNTLPEQLEVFKAMKQEESYKTAHLPASTELINQIKEHARRIGQGNTVNFHREKRSSNAKGKGKSEKENKNKSNLPRCTYKDCLNPVGHIENNCIAKYPERKEEILEAHKRAKEIRWKKKQQEKDEKEKSHVTMIHRHHSSDSALNMQSFIKPWDKTTINKMKTPSWKVIIDSGATSHIFANKDLIFDYKPNPSFVETGSGELLKCPGQNKVKIDMEGPDGITEVVVENIIWCPELGYNLLSTISLSRRGIEVFLRSQDKPSEFRKDGRIFGLADIIDNQYVVRGDPFNVNLVNIAVSPSVLHRRLGHLNWGSVMQLPRFATGIELQGKKPEEICDGCMKGHQEKKIGHARMPRATEPFQLIHTDIGEPFPFTRKGHRYYISFLDDYSGAVHVYLCKAKSETLVKFKEYKAMIELQSGKQIKFLRSNNDGEFDNLGFEQLLQKTDIQWEPTAAYASNQNGKAERINYTLMSIVRSILYSMKLPKSLWGELILIAAFLRNRCSHESKPSSFEIINGISPDLRHLRIIELRAWIHISKERRKKLNERSWQGILIEYEAGTSNYRIYNPLNGKVEVIHSINVDEDNLYDRSQVESKEFADEDWQEADDEEFGDAKLPNISEALQDNTSTPSSTSSSFADITSSAND